MLTFSKVTQTIHNGIIYKSLYTEYKGHTVYFDQQLPTLVTAAVICFDFTKPGIIVSADFPMLSENTQEFLLEHEIGHIENGHIQVSEDAQVAGSIEAFQKALEEYFDKRLVTIDENELIADKHAVQVLGSKQVINALEELKDFVAQQQTTLEFLNLIPVEQLEQSKLMADKACTELEERIRHINENVYVF